MSHYPQFAKVSLHARKDGLTPAKVEELDTNNILLYQIHLFVFYFFN